MAAIGVNQRAQSFRSLEGFCSQMLPRPQAVEGFAWVGFVDNVPSPTGNKRFHGSFANRQGSVGPLAAIIARNPPVTRGLPRWDPDGGWIANRL